MVSTNRKRVHIKTIIKLFCQFLFSQCAEYESLQINWSSLFYFNQGKCEWLDTFPWLHGARVPQLPQPCRFCHGGDLVIFFQPKTSTKYIYLWYGFNIREGLNELQNIDLLKSFLFWCHAHVNVFVLVHCISKNLLAIFIK